MRLLSKGSHSSTVLTLVCAVWPLFGSNRVAMRTQSVIHSPNGSSHSCARLIAVSLPPASLPPTPLSFCCRRRHYAVPFVIFLLYFHPWKCGLLSSYTLVFVVSILGTKGTTPLLLRLFSRHNNSGSCGVIRLIFLGGGWPDDVRFPRRSGDSPPLVVVS